MTDPIADMIIRMKNAEQSGKDSLSFPFSKMKMEICSVLENKGFIKSASKKGKKAKSIEVFLLSDASGPKIRGVRRISKPSRRIYKKFTELRPIKNGYGALILSTPKGIMANNDARKNKVGGEALFEIW